MRLSPELCFKFCFLDTGEFWLWRIIWVILAELEATDSLYTNCPIAPIKYWWSIQSDLAALRAPYGSRAEPGLYLPRRGKVMSQGLLVGAPPHPVTAGFTKNNNSCLILFEITFKAFLGGRVAFRTKGGCSKTKCLFCIFIRAFTVTGSSCHPGQRINLSDPSISSCKSTVCYWGWFTTRPIPVIISCNYKFIRRGRLMEKCGLFLYVCVYLCIYFLCIYIFMGMWNLIYGNVNWNAESGAIQDSAMLS